jgi:antitoxin CcdA
MQDRPAKPKKKSVNLSIDAALAAEAKAAGTNMSALLERALWIELKEHREAQWREENRAAIEASNRHFEQHGLPLAKYRTW